MIAKPEVLPFHRTLDWGMISWQVMKSIAPPAKPRQKPINVSEIFPTYPPINAPTPIGNPAYMVKTSTLNFEIPLRDKGTAIAIPSGILCSNMIIAKLTPRVEFAASPEPIAKPSGRL